MTKEQNKKCCFPDLQKGILTSSIIILPQWKDLIKISGIILGQRCNHHGVPTRNSVTSTV